MENDTHNDMGKLLVLFGQNYVKWHGKFINHIDYKGWNYHFLYDSFEDFFATVHEASQYENQCIKLLQMSEDADVDEEYTERQRQKDIFENMKLCNPRVQLEVQQKRIWDAEEIKIIALLRHCTEVRFHLNINRAVSAKAALAQIRKDCNQEESGNMMNLMNSFYRDTYQPNDTLVGFSTRIQRFAQDIQEARGKPPSFADLQCFKILSSLPPQYDQLQQQIFQLPADKFNMTELIKIFSIEDSRQLANKQMKQNDKNRKHIQPDEALAIAYDKINNKNKLKKQKQKLKLKQKQQQQLVFNNNVNNKPQANQNNNNNNNNQNNNSNRKCSICKKYLPKNHSPNYVKCTECHKAEKDRAESGNFVQVLEVTAYKKQPSNSKTWYIDSGCTNHVSNSITSTINLQDSSRPICTASGAITHATNLGTAVFNTDAGPVHFQETLIVPEITKNLLSVKQITANAEDTFVIFHGNQCHVVKGQFQIQGQVILQGQVDRSGLYAISPHVDPDAFSSINNNNSVNNVTTSINNSMNNLSNVNNNTNINNDNSFSKNLNNSNNILNADEQVNNNNSNSLNINNNVDSTNSRLNNVLTKMNNVINRKSNSNDFSKTETVTNQQQTANNIKIATTDEHNNNNTSKIINNSNATPKEQVQNLKINIVKHVVPTRTQPNLNNSNLIKSNNVACTNNSNNNNNLINNNIATNFKQINNNNVKVINKNVAIPHEQKATNNNNKFIKNNNATSNEQINNNNNIINNNVASTHISDVDSRHCQDCSKLLPKKSIIKNFKVCKVCFKKHKLDNNNDLSNIDNTNNTRSNNNLINSTTSRHSVSNIEKINNDNLNNKLINNDNFNKIYQVNNPTSTNSPVLMVRSLQEWHRCLGHINKKAILQLAETTEDFEVTHADEDIKCTICDAAKMNRKKFAEVMPDRAKQAGEVIYSDICGKISPPSIGGSQFVVHFLDERSGYIFCYIVKHKSDAFELFKMVRARLNNHGPSEVKYFVTDGGGEYVGGDFQEFLNEKGIVHAKSPANTPQRQGKSERLNKILFDAARAMIKERQMPRRFWGLAVLYAAYIRNRTVKPGTNKTRHELMFGTKPSVKHCLPFGQPVMYHNHDPHIKKLDNRSFKGYFVGFHEENHAFKIWNESTQTLILTRDLKPCPQEPTNFANNDHGQPFVVEDTNNWITGGSPFVIDFQEDDDEDLQFNIQQIINNDDNNINFNNHNNRILNHNPQVINNNNNNINRDLNINQPILNQQDQIINNNNNDNRINFNLDDFDEDSVDIFDNPLQVNNNQRNNNPIINQPINNNNDRYVNINNNNENGFISSRLRNRPAKDQALSAEQIEEILGLEDLEPQTYQQAIRSEHREHWLASIKEEQDCLIANSTFQVVPRPTHKKAIQSRYVFKIKTDENGAIARFKTRLVAKGFTQVQGVDYFDTFSPALRLASLRYLISIAVLKNFIIYHLDVQTAFLNGDLEEEIYMEIPEGFDTINQDRRSHVLRLLKSIYGLRQASRNWNIKFTIRIIKKMGFVQSQADPCIFIKYDKNGETRVILGIFVDDCFVVGAEKDVKEIRDALMEEFKMHDLGPLSYALGIKVVQEDNKITLSQAAYIMKCVEKFNMQNSSPQPTPLPEKPQRNNNIKSINNNDKLINDNNIKSNINKSNNISVINKNNNNLSRDKNNINNTDQQNNNNDDVNNANQLFEDVNLYQQLIGSLIYLANATRPDISFAVGYLARSMNAPTNADWINAKRVLRYLNATKNLAINYKSKDKLIGYSDSSYAEELDRKSVGGYVFLQAGAAITWRSTKQEIIAQSSMEAEYIALAEAAKECVWIKKLHKEIFPKSADEAVIIYEDNQSAIKLAENPIHTNRSKHIDVRYHVIREYVKNNVITLQYLPTAEMIADIMTKSLGKVLHARFVAGMGLEF